MVCNADKLKLFYLTKPERSLAGRTRVVDRLLRHRGLNKVFLFIDYAVAQVHESHESACGCYTQWDSYRNQLRYTKFFGK